MNRAELERRAFDVLRADMQNIGMSDAELMEAIAQEDAATLEEFLEEVNNG